MASAGMEAIVQEVRGLIGDPVSSTQTFRDAEIERALDRYRTDARYQQLRAEPTILYGGSVQYLTFYADCGPWKAGAVVLDGTYGTVTPAGTAVPNAGTADWTVGILTYAGSAQSPYGPVRPLSVVGTWYDVYGAAADLAQEWAAAVATEFDFQDSNQRFARSQQYTNLMALAQRLRARQSTGFITGKQVRTDVEGS